LTNNTTGRSVPSAPGPDQPQCHGIWGVVRTNPQCEHYANANLQHRGRSTFLPTYAARSNHGFLIHRPLFPCYLFVAFDDPTIWRPVRETPGVHSVLTSGNHVQPVSHNAVSALQASEAQRNATPLPDAAWNVGDACCISHEPFQHIVAAISALNGHLATISIIMLGQLRDITVPITDIVRAE